MKDFKQLIKNKASNKPIMLDEKSVFFVFQLIIKEEYGRLGSENIKPDYLKDKKIFIKVIGTNWANEIWLNRAQIVKKVNDKLGGEEIKDLAVSN